MKNRMFCSKNKRAIHIGFFFVSPKRYHFQWYNVLRCKKNDWPSTITDCTLFVNTFYRLSTCVLWRDEWTRCSFWYIIRVILFFILGDVLPWIQLHCSILCLSDSVASSRCKPLYFHRRDVRFGVHYELFSFTNVTAAFRWYMPVILRIACWDHVVRFGN